MPTFESLQIKMKFNPLLITLLLSTNIFAQSINENWIGIWQKKSQEGVITISKNRFNGCNWIGSQPKNTPRKCVAYFIDPISKSDLIESLNRDSESAKYGYQNKLLSKKEYKEELNLIRNKKMILNQLSEDKFQTVFIDQGENNNPDCGTIYFLDKGYLYASASCEGGLSQNFFISQFTRRQ